MTISATTQGLRPGVCTSSNRPVTPFEGQTIYETDTDLTLVYSGSAWLYSSTPQTLEIGAWQAWTPTITSDGGSLGSTSVINARYSQINKTVVCTLDVRVTGVGSATGGLRFTLPVTMTTNCAVDGAIGSWREYNTTGETGVVCKQTTTIGVLRRYDNGAILNTGRYFGATFMYEAA